jgi:hypothetical protein
MIFNYNLGPGGRYELEFVISSCIYKIDYFTIRFCEFSLHIVVDDIPALVQIPESILK